MTTRPSLTRARRARIVVGSWMAIVGAAATVGTETHAAPRTLGSTATEMHAAAPPPSPPPSSSLPSPPPPPPRSPLPAEPREPHEVSKVECFTHHGDAQIARRQGRLLHARAALQVCSSAVCPSAIRADCVDWLGEVNRSVPSVVVTARARGRDVTDVKVFVDDAPMAARLTGASLEIDPGEHRFRFESPPWPAKDLTILVSEGVKGRPIDVEFAPPAPKTIEAVVSPPRPVETPRRTALHPANRFDYLLGGAGVASLVTAAAVGGWGLWLRHQYENSCAPFCSEEQRSSVRSKLVIADVALGVAVVSAVAIYFHLARGQAPEPASGPPTNSVALLLGAETGGAEVGARVTF